MRRSFRLILEGWSLQRAVYRVLSFMATSHLLLARVSPNMTGRLQPRSPRLSLWNCTFPTPTWPLHLSAAIRLKTSKVLLKSHCDLHLR